MLPALLKDLTSNADFTAVEIAGYDVGGSATLAQDDIFQTASLTGITDAGLLTFSYNALQEQAVSARAGGSVATTGNFSIYLSEAAANVTPDAATATLPATESGPGPLTYFVQLRDSGGNLLTGDDGATWFAVESPSAGQDAPVSAITFSSLDLTLESGSDLPQAFLDEARQSAFTQVELAGYSSGGYLVMDDLYGSAEIIQNTANADGSDSLDFSYDTVIDNSYTHANVTDTLFSTDGWDLITKAADTTPAYAAAAPLTALPASAYAQTPPSYFVEFVTGGTTLTAPGGVSWFAINNLSFGSDISGTKLQFGDLSFSLGSDAILPALLTDTANGHVITKLEIAGYTGAKLVQDDIFETNILTSFSADAAGSVSLGLEYGTLQEQSSTALPSTTDGWDNVTKSQAASISIAAPENHKPTAQAASGALTYFVQIKLANGSVVPGTDDAQWFAVTNIGSSQTNSLSTNGTASANLVFGALSFSLALGTELPGLFFDEAENTEIGQIELAGYSTGAQDALVVDDLFDNLYISATNDNGADSTTGISFSYDELVQQSYTGTGRSVALAESSGWNKATNAAATSPQFASAAPLDSLPVEVTCFLAGTRIATECGLVPVECLAIGMKVQTLHAGLQPIKWIGARTYTAPFCNHEKILPIRIRAHAIAENIPARDLFVSPGHAMVLDDALIHAARLINGVSITQEAAMAEVRYFHIELATHEAIFAEGAPAETFRGEYFRNQFHNAAEFAEAYPGDAAPEVACLPELRSGFQFAAILRRLKSRAGIARPAAPGPLAGYIDAVSPTHIIGWAADTMNLDEPVVLDVLAGGSLIGRTIANIHRPDVAAAGFGAGHHGFEVALGDEAGPVTIRRSADGETLWNGGHLASGKQAAAF